jgi:hypothetical protein
MKHLNKYIFTFCLLSLGFFIVGFGNSYSKEFEENFITDDSKDRGFASEKSGLKDVFSDKEERDDSAITGIRIDEESLDDGKEGKAKKIELPKIRLSEVDEKDFADIVVLQGLDKVTAKISTFEVEVGESAKFKRLEVHPKKCWKSPPEENPENKVLLEIYENRLDGKREKLFYGWMFSSSPGLSSLEHPVYDIALIDCRFSESDEEDEEENEEKSNEQN